MELLHKEHLKRTLSLLPNLKKLNITIQGIASLPEDLLRHNTKVEQFILNRDLSSNTYAPLSGPAFAINSICDANDANSTLPAIAELLAKHTVITIVPNARGLVRPVIDSSRLDALLDVSRCPHLDLHNVTSLNYSNAGKFKYNGVEQNYANILLKHPIFQELLSQKVIRRDWIADALKQLHVEHLKRTLSLLPNLKKLSIVITGISSLPENLFIHNTKVEKLEIWDRELVSFIQRVHRVNEDAFASKLAGFPVDEFNLSLKSFGSNYGYNLLQPLKNLRELVIKSNTMFPPEIHSNNVIEKIEIYTLADHGRDDIDISDYSVEAHKDELQEVANFYFNLARDTGRNIEVKIPYIGVHFGRPFNRSDFDKFDPSNIENFSLEQLRSLLQIANGIKKPKVKDLRKRKALQAAIKEIELLLAE